MIGPMTAPAARMMLPPGPTLRKLRFQMIADMVSLTVKMFSCSYEYGENFENQQF